MQLADSPLELRRAAPCRVALRCAAVSCAKGGSVCVWLVTCELSSGAVHSVVARHSVNTGAYNFFRPSVLWPTPAELRTASAVLGCSALCDRALLLLASDAPSTLLLLDCATLSAVARLETEEREVESTVDDADIAALLPPSSRSARFMRRYGMVMSAQLYRTRAESTEGGQCAARSSAEYSSSRLTVACGCVDCRLYVVCGMESGHVAVFRVAVPRRESTASATEQSSVLARPLVCELKLHDEPGQSQHTHSQTASHSSVHRNSLVD